jgi:pimeloyl-ACP methyl ester carboxylesterase
MSGVTVDARYRASSLTIDGIRSPVIEAGPAEARTAAVFVHGNPGSTRDWEDLLVRVGEFGRAIAFDMPGFGAADKPRDFDYTVAGYARHLGRVLDAVGVQRVHLVMHDFGGPWGLSWAAAKPAAVASLTCIDTGILLGYRWHYLARIWQTPILGELFMATTTRFAMRALLRHGNPRGLPEAYFDHVYRTFDGGTRRAVLKLYRNTREPGSAMQALAQALRPRDLPALVLWGAHDPYIPATYARRQQETFPRAEVVVLENSGHWPFADDPEAVAAAVVPFLRSQMKAG